MEEEIEEKISLLQRRLLLFLVSKETKYCYFAFRPFFFPGDIRETLMIMLIILIREKKNYRLYRGHKR